MLTQLRAYYLLTKPGIVRGNAVHVLAGVLLASRWPINWSVLFGVLVGTSLVIASACVANNYMDRGIDVRMKRTKARPSVTGQISLQTAMVYAAALLIVGFGILLWRTNAYVVTIGVIAYVLYVFAYGWAKRNTVHSTLIGAIPGALPAMAGYVAVTNTLSLGAWLIFLLVLVWQMPHFYAISLFRKKEYAAAELPVLGVVKPFSIVKRYIGVYVIIYCAIVIGMTLAGTFQLLAGILMAVGAAFWLSIAFMRAPDEKKWAYKVFGTSLLLTLVLLAVSIVTMFLGPKS